MTIEADDPEVNRFIHRALHLRARKGIEPYAEACLISDQCWPITEPPPQWALDLAEAGDPGSKWCPVISPELLTHE